MPTSRALFVVPVALLASCAAGPEPAVAPPYGAPPQYGAAPQYGAPPQYGAAPPYGAPPQYGAPPPYGAPPQYGAPPHTPAAPPAAAGACGAITECGACTNQPACRWCTEPRGCTPAGTPCTGLSLAHANTCDNDPVERTRLLTQRDEARTQGLVADGPPIVGRLESFPGVSFNIARGRCYAAIVRYGAGARLGDVQQNQSMDTREESTNGGSLAQPSTPGLPTGLSCPRSPGRLSLWFQDRWTRARVASAGKGEISVQLYSAPISEADLRAGDAKAAAIDRKIERMPAGCDDCDYNCRSSGTACERRCFVDFAGGRSGRSGCEYNCQQITRACQDSCAAQCR
ncbi:MAG: hypothetical protein QM820_28665 [Minicystis sp.]